MWTAVGCGGDDNTDPPSGGGSGGSTAGAAGSPAGSGGDNTAGAGGNNTAGSGGEAGGESEEDGGKMNTKKIGSACTATTDCAADLTCDTTIPNGMCTKTCAMDTDCAGRTDGVCIDTKCYAGCTLDADAGTQSTKDGGTKPKAPCKHKALACQEAPGHTSWACTLAPDAGTDPEEDSGAPEEDAPSTADDGGTDASE